MKSVTDPRSRKCVAVTELQQQLGHAELATTQIYAAAISGRRRATVMALEFGGVPGAHASTST